MMEINKEFIKKNLSKIIQKNKKTIDSLNKTGAKYSYDKEADVLYLVMQNIEADNSRRSGDDIVTRYKDGKSIGYTILNVSKRNENGEIISNQKIKTTPTTIRLSEDTISDLEDIAKDSGALNTTEIIRTAINEYVDRQIQYYVERQIKEYVKRGMENILQRHAG